MLLKGKNLTFSRGAAPLFSTLSFALDEGESLAIRGANGAGKTTFLKLVSGLIPPSPQKLYWKEAPLASENLKAYQQNLLVVGHKSCLYPEARLKDQIHMWKDLYGVFEKDIRDALKFWGLEPLIDRKISHLSQGQQKRLSLSRCLWLPRPLWILDEPHGNLDGEGKALLSMLIADHLTQKGSLIIATHETFPTAKEIFLC